MPQRGYRLRGWAAKKSHTMSVAFICVFATANVRYWLGTDWSPGWCFWAFAAGAVLGLSATFRIQREIRPEDPDPRLGAW